MANKIDDLLKEFDSLSLEEQEEMLDIGRKRVIQRKREVLIKEVKEAEQEYAAGKLKSKENNSMKEINYVVWKEDKYYVSRCLNVEVSSFGETIDEAIKNLKEAVELYFEGNGKEITPIESIMLGKETINA